MIQLLQGQKAIETSNLPLHYRKLVSMVDQIKLAFGANSVVEVTIYDIIKSDDPKADVNLLSEESLLQGFDSDSFKKVK